MAIYSWFTHYKNGDFPCKRLPEGTYFNRENESIDDCNMTIYLVGGLEHDFYFSIYWECHHPNWLS